MHPADQLSYTATAIINHIHPAFLLYARYNLCHKFKPAFFLVACNTGNTLYQGIYIGFLKRSKELGDQRTDVTYMERTGVSDMYEVIQWPNKLIGNISTGTMVWEQDFILYRYAQYYTMLAELRYHRKDYSGALTALNTLAQRAYGKANFYTDSSAAAVRQALVDENLKEFAEEGNVYFTLIRLGAIHDYNPYRYVDGLGQCGIDTSRPNQLLMPVSKKAMNKNNKITQTQGWS